MSKGIFKRLQGEQRLPSLLAIQISISAVLNVTGQPIILIRLPEIVIAFAKKSWKIVAGISSASGQPIGIGTGGWKSRGCLGICDSVQAEMLQKLIIK